MEVFFIGHFFQTLSIDFHLASASVVLHADELPFEILNVGRLLKLQGELELAVIEGEIENLIKIAFVHGPVNFRNYGQEHFESVSEIHNEIEFLIPVVVEPSNERNLF